MFISVLSFSGLKFDFSAYVRYCLIMDFVIKVRMILGIVTIFFVNSFMDFFLNGRFCIICGFVMKFRKWFIWVCEINILVCICDVGGIFLLWCSVCFFVVLNWYLVKFGIYFFIVLKVSLLVIMESIWCWIC